ncbi:alpha-amylase family glycosyl hydrolase [Granulosicoccaceae sp. 1_MG-2023]|nr:alpha-amylase family glycosyl hydrolase [Granulosicoccaceae sp. 1_MG-2023]
MPLTSGTLNSLRTRLARLYPDEDTDELLERLGVICSRHERDHSPPTVSRRWDESDTLLITYGDSLTREDCTPLQALESFSSTYLKSSIGIIHLLPFFPYSSDDGFSVINYRSVNPEVGNWEQVSRIGSDFDLMFDFVLNHVSRDSLWFADFLENMPPGNRYFIEADPDDPRLKLVTRPRAEPLMVRIRTRHDVRHVWATFSKDQIDLNYANPDVLLQALDILLYYIRQGARIVRLDAVAFLWKELGTSCIHLPQTHEVIKLMRDLMDDLAPEVILLTETNVPHKENVSYFGDGDEAHMVYQFSLPPLMLHAIYSGSTRYLRQWLQALEPAPPGCTFLNFTASHDGVGLRALEGIVPQDEVNDLLDAMRKRGGFISHRTQADGSQSPYELNISYFDALRDPDAYHDMWHINRFLLSQTAAMSLQGVPAIYIHSLLATPNYQEGVENTGRTRTINRRRWDLDELTERLDDPGSAAHIVFNTLRKRLALRRQQPAFHPDTRQLIFDLDDSLLALQRVSPDGLQTITCLYNFTAVAKTVRLNRIGLEGSLQSELTDLISGDRPRGAIDSPASVVVPAYGCYWLTRDQA